MILSPKRLGTVDFFDAVDPTILKSALGIGIEAMLDPEHKFQKISSSYAFAEHPFKRDCEGQGSSLPTRLRYTVKHRSNKNTLLFANEIEHHTTLSVVPVASVGTV